MPTTPQPWDGGSDFDVQIHTRDLNNEGDSIASHAADHGADCAPPPATHTIDTVEQAVFICHDHVMTAIKDSGYGDVVLTPDEMADWSSGPVTVGWSVSTLRTTSRDWITVDVTPFNEQLALPFNTGEVDLQGLPKQYIELRQDMDTWNGKAQTHWRMTRDSGNWGHEDAADEWPYFDDQTGITPSAVTRTPFEFTFDRTSYVFRVAPSAPVGGGKVIFQGKWSSPLAFTQGVVQFSHHSYNPDKCDVTNITCAADTWHWSNFSISNAVHYTMLKPTDHQAVTGSGGPLDFSVPAPAGSFLKFAAIGSVQVSYDGGKTYAPAQKPPMDPSLYHEEHFTSYLTPVPQGATSILFKLAGGWYGQAMARDFSLISLQ
jgi:hypothetical protein